MREIKFRAWDKENKIMCEVVCLNLRPTYPEHIIIPVGGKVGTEYNCLKENLELIQFTGLHDKNGVEIYEGDIVIDDEYPEEGISYGKVAWGIAGWIIDPWFATAEFEKEINNYGVIGNIYENKELLNA